MSFWTNGGTSDMIFGWIPGGIPSNRVPGGISAEIIRVVFKYFQRKFFGRDF